MGVWTVVSYGDVSYDDEKRESLSSLGVVPVSPISLVFASVTLSKEFVELAKLSNVKAEIVELSTKVVATDSVVISAVPNTQIRPNLKVSELTTFSVKMGCRYFAEDSFKSVQSFKHFPYVFPKITFEHGTMMIFAKGSGFHSSTVRSC